MNFNESNRNVPVEFYKDDYGTIYYQSSFTQGTAPTLKDAFAEFSREDFARDFVFYFDDVIDVKVGRFVPPFKDKKLKGMVYLGKLEIQVETGKLFKDSKNSLTYLSTHKNEIPRHKKWIMDMKQAVNEMFDPLKTSHDLICEHCGSIIPKGTYYEFYRKNPYHLECIWDKIINKKNSNTYEGAKKYFFSLSKKLGNWPAYGLDVEDDYKHDLELVKHNERLTNGR